MRRALAALLVFGSASAHARTIEVGPAREVKSPAAAVRIAGDGDTIVVDPGEYLECFRVSQNHLTIAGAGTGATLSDTACDGKALIVVSGTDLTLRNLTLQRVRVPDGNGAGVRLEGRSLVVEKSRFVNNQTAIMATGVGGSVIRISDTQFEGNGGCDGTRCANALSIGAIDRLRIENSVLRGTKGGHVIMSLAHRTELSATRIEDGPTGSASFDVIIPAGGLLLMENCTIQKGRNAAGLRGAVFLDGSAEGGQVFRRNKFINETGQSVPFILNWSTGSPALLENSVGDDAVISSSGYYSNRAGWLVRESWSTAKGLVTAAGRELRDIGRSVRDWMVGR